MRSRIWKGVFAALGMLVLILDAKTALQGGLDGVRVCLMAVIPSLLPFFVLSILLTSSLSGLRIKALRPVGSLCRMPAGSEVLLILGLLGGYPTGAQAVAQSYRKGQLTKTDAQRLLGFCSNAGPSFLFGIAAATFGQLWMVWVLWLCHIASALITGWLLPGSPQASTCRQSRNDIGFAQAVEQAVKIMGKVCAWIILFRVLLGFLDHWFGWFISSQIRVILTGILELANGCLLLDQIPSTGLRFVVCAGILSFGGISVVMQTVSVTGELGLGMYLPGKIIQSAVSILLSYLIQLVTFGTERYLLSPFVLAGTALLLAVIFLFLKNNSRNPAKVIV